MHRDLLLFSCLAALVACTHPTGSENTPPPASAAGSPTEAPNASEPASRAQGLAIGTIVTHDAKVSILSSLSGDLRVVVRKMDGAIVADGITFDELKTTDPLLHTIVTNAVASRSGASDRREGPYIDATYHRPDDTPASDREKPNLSGPSRLR